MKKSLLATILVTTALAATQALALPPVVAAPGARSNTNGYLGLSWTLGGSKVPAVVVGVFNTRVKADGDTEGSHLSLSVNVENGVKLQRAKLGYIKGQEDGQGEIAAGYDFSKGEPLLGLGVNLPYLGLGVDLYRNRDIAPYLDLRTQDEFDKPAAPAPNPV